MHQNIEFIQNCRQSWLWGKKKYHQSLLFGVLLWHGYEQLHLIWCICSKVFVILLCCVLVDVVIAFWWAGIEICTVWITAHIWTLPLQCMKALSLVCVWMFSLEVYEIATLSAESMAVFLSFKCMLKNWFHRILPWFTLWRYSWCFIVAVVKTRLQTLHKGAGEQHYNGILHCFK